MSTRDLHSSSKYVIHPISTEAFAWLMGLPLFLLLLAWGLIGVVYQVPAVPVYCLSERSNNKLSDWSESGKPGAYLHVALMWHSLSAELVCDKLRSCGLRMQNLLSSFDRIHKDPERKR